MRDGEAPTGPYDERIAYLIDLVLAHLFELGFGEFLSLSKPAALSISTSILKF